MSQRKFDFYIVPTPIGNISDITLRALDVLKSVDLIACEDTRITQKLLNHYCISTRCISCHKYNEKERIGFFIDELKSGKTIALVSDAGTPMICDPGEVIVQELLNAGFSITSLPGATAITTFLSQIPRENEEFTFIGFIPRTESKVEEIIKKHMYDNLIFYDAPERIIKTLNIIKNIKKDAKIALGRELSKLYEEIVIDNIDNVIQYYSNGIKGEIVCFIYANTKEKAGGDYESHIKSLKDKGFKNKDISIILSTLFDVNKNEIYKQILEL